MQQRKIAFRAWNIETNQFELPLYRGIANLNINDILQGSTLRYQQFTGLSDKNGKEIYEGDMVKFRSHPDKAVTGEIKWSDSNLKWYLAYFADQLERNRNYPSTYGLHHITEIEVIGNIYNDADKLLKWIIK